MASSTASVHAGPGRGRAESAAHRAGVAGSGRDAGVEGSIVPPTSAALIALIALGPLTCLEGDPDDPTHARARAVWIEDCADCHGLTGLGDGQRASELDPPPPDFRDPCRKITDEWIERVILSGGASYGGSEAMRAHHELHHDREVLEQLVAYVQLLRDPGPCTERGDAHREVEPEAP
jgi:mono/diheme cytochrome c family protein